MIGPTKTSAFVFVLCNTHRRRPRSKPCLSDDDLLSTEVQPRFSSVVTILVHLRIRHNRLPRRKFFKSLFTVEHALVPARSRSPDSPAQPEAIDGPFEWKTRWGFRGLSRDYRIQNHRVVPGRSKFHFSLYAYDSQCCSFFLSYPICNKSGTVVPEKKDA
jgi:hypothetical protein